MAIDLKEQEANSLVSWVDQKTFRLHVFVHAQMPPYHFFFQCNKFQNTNSPRKNNLQILKIHVVDFLIQKCGLNFTEDEIFRMIGIIKTNAVHVEKPMFKEQKISGHVVYPTVSFMSHSCVSNARCW